MRRFGMTLAVAVLLGFATIIAQEIPADPVTPEPTPEPTPTPVAEPTAEEKDAAHQMEFNSRNAAAKVGENLDDEKRTQCNFFVDNAYFNIAELSGPFVHNVAIGETTS